MRLSSFLAVLFLAVLLAVPAQALQCVPYAREVSGLRLQGNAWQWWDAAAGNYERGSRARNGAVLVFSRQGSMRYGHVSVVSRVVAPRLVLVDHANWAPTGTQGRGKVTQGVPVLDVSANNDWSSVRVWYAPAGDFGGRVYRTNGFVYGGAGENAPQRGLPAIERAALTKAATLLPNAQGLRPPEVKPQTIPAKAAPPPPPPPELRKASQPQQNPTIRAAKRIFGHRASAQPGFLFN